MKAAAAISATQQALPEGRPTVCLVDHGALRFNLSKIRERVGPRVKILSMVKANAYGHGAGAVTHTLRGAGSDAFGVATVSEGIELRRAGIEAPILIVGGTYEEQLGDLIEHALTPAVYDVDGLKKLDAAVGRRGAMLGIHLKIDTGMGRLGLAAADYESWSGAIKKLGALRLDGIFSHFSHAESVAGDYTRRQLEIFNDVLERLRGANIRPPLAHLANSAATITLPSAYFDMVRPGIMLYGVHPAADMAAAIDLQPVLTWKTKILQLKKVPAGSSISYGQTFVAKRESLIATLPVGYADGYPRLLSNRGEVLVRGQSAPVAGRVCMDLTMIDVTDIRNVRQGDEVILLGRQGDAEISADRLAAWANTISYEILTSISARVPRIHYNC
jgi:alanine racemase